MRVLRYQCQTISLLTSHSVNKLLPNCLVGELPSPARSFRSIGGHRRQDSFLRRGCLGTCGWFCDFRFIFQGVKSFKFRNRNASPPPRIPLRKPFFFSGSPCAPSSVQKALQLPLCLYAFCSIRGHGTWFWPFVSFEIEVLP
jgi:hypothetical protein